MVFLQIRNGPGHALLHNLHIDGIDTRHAASFSQLPQLPIGYHPDVCRVVVFDSTGPRSVQSGCPQPDVALAGQHLGCKRPGPVCYKTLFRTLALPMVPGLSPSRADVNDQDQVDIMLFLFADSNPIHRPLHVVDALLHPPYDINISSGCTITAKPTDKAK